MVDLPSRSGSSATFKLWLDKNTVVSTIVRSKTVHLKCFSNWTGTLIINAVIKKKIIMFHYAELHEKLK